jgi:hypothetical protein
MDRLELPTGSGNAIGTGTPDTGGTARIGLSEPIKRLALQTPGPGAAESTGAGRLRGHAFTRGRGIIERLDFLPALFRALEEDGLAVVAGGDEGGFGGERERGVGQRRRADDLDCRGRLARAAGVDDADRRVVACGALAGSDDGV